MPRFVLLLVTLSHGAIESTYVDGLGANVARFSSLRRFELTYFEEAEFRPFGRMGGLYFTGVSNRLAWSGIDGLGLTRLLLTSLGGSSFSPGYLRVSFYWRRSASLAARYLLSTASSGISPL